MSTTLLPITHPDIQRRIALGHKYGNRASVFEFEAQFEVGEKRDRLLYNAVCDIAIAQHHFAQASLHADYSEPDVRLSTETWRAFEAERERAANEKPSVYPGKGAHWAAKRAAKAA